MSTTTVTRPAADAPRAEIFRSYLEVPPRDDEELHYWIRTFTGFDIPRRSVCPDHDAPFAYVADQFFERETAVLALGSRTSGKSLNTAILDLCEAVFKPGVSILELAAVREQALAVSEHLIAMCSIEEPLYELLTSVTKNEIRFQNGSRIRISTATYGAVSTGHPTKVRIGDVELLPLSIVNEALSLSIGHPDGWNAQTTLFGTRKVLSGTMARLLSEASARGLRVYSTCIWETVQRCARECVADPTHGTCAALHAKCAGRAHYVPEGGWYPIRDLVAKARLIDDETWARQWENRDMPVPPARPDGVAS